MTNAVKKLKKRNNISVVLGLVFSAADHCGPLEINRTELMSVAPVHVSQSTEFTEPQSTTTPRP